VNGSPGFTPIFRGDALDPGGIDLGLRHADHVLVGHAHGEMPRSLPHQPSARLRAAVGDLDRRQPVEDNVAHIGCLDSG